MNCCGQRKNWRLCVDHFSSCTGNAKRWLIQPRIPAFFLHTTTTIASHIEKKGSQLTTRANNNNNNKNVQKIYVVLSCLFISPNFEWALLSYAMHAHRRMPNLGQNLSMVQWWIAYCVLVLCMRTHKQCTPEHAHCDNSQRSKRSNAREKYKTTERKIDLFILTAPEFIAPVSNGNYAMSLAPSNYHIHFYCIIQEQQICITSIFSQK